jgi:gamma-glutamyl hercynylcysteine S-oxide synthase
MATTSSAGLDRAAVRHRFHHARARTRILFDLLDDSWYHQRPIALRNPVVFYEGHLPAFAVNTLIKKALGSRGIDERLEVVFARGIDPESEATAIARGNPAWPARGEVAAYAAAADRVIESAIMTAELERPGHPMLRGAEALWTILEHEEMHHETLVYMWHQVPYEGKRAPRGYVTLPIAHTRATAGGGRVTIPAGDVTLGTDTRESFGWDNERPAHRVGVEAFSIAVDNVTNAEFLEFVEAGGYRDPRWWRDEDWAWVTSESVNHPPFWEREGQQWYWRGMFERVPLPANWPVYATWAEARAFALWRGMRLPTEAEFHRAAYGTPSNREQPYPWGAAMPATPPGNFDFVRWDPEPVGWRPEGTSAFGVRDLVGNGWEWTSTVFAPFSGFAPMPSYPEYSADFFDGEHFVMKGASPVTARTLVRRGFRNWFRPRYPYVYATFRCVGPA